MKLTFSHEIRLGEIVTALAFAGGAIGIYVSSEKARVQLEGRVSVVEAAQVMQVQATREVRSELQNVSSEIRTDIRDLRQEVRRGNGRTM